MEKLSALQRAGTKAQSEERHAPETLHSVPPSQTGSFLKKKKKKNPKWDSVDATVPGLLNAIPFTFFRLTSHVFSTCSCISSVLLIFHPPSQAFKRFKKQLALAALFDEVSLEQWEDLNAFSWSACELAVDLTLATLAYSVSVCVRHKRSKGGRLLNLLTCLSETKRLTKGGRERRRATPFIMSPPPALLLHLLPGQCSS